MGHSKEFGNWKGFIESIRGVKVDNPRKDARQDKIELSTYITYIMSEGKSIYDDPKVRPYWDRFQEKENKNKTKAKRPKKTSLKKLFKNLFKSPFKKKKVKEKGEGKEKEKHTFGFMEPGRLEAAKKNLERIKKENPEKYKEMQQQTKKILNKAQKEFEALKKEDPEKYKEIQQQTKEILDEARKR